MQVQSIIIYFFYGLAFFSMGLLVATEGGRSSDDRVRKALRPLAGFGLVHAAHEWLEMFVPINTLSGHTITPIFFILQTLHPFLLISFACGIWRLLAGQG